ncbi:hypothetical protein UA08_03409 [Talaromyces atroroseus]|uniref:Uncharacterized protein n=1 Tax=Talaromyces atroroseus TaxID=1441469 RepID=A0A225AR30_TALAT|nr:hypothetical protein UA08_03409 [Talaromyces atroroseus]OKL60824.1 hypothetical protein UA08_03409 [Talaromyces atroroseus]
MTASTLRRAGYGNISLLCLVFLTLSRVTLAESILAFAPVTALAGLDGLNARHLAGACPASTQTACADGLGCCPIGAACTYSRDVPVCDESCNGGPSCPNGGCCQSGYVCGTTNNLCSPTTKPTIASAPTPAKEDGQKEVDDHDNGIVVTPTTPPSAPLHAEPTPSTDDPLPGSSSDSGTRSGSVHLPTSTKTPTVPSSPSVVSATSTTTSGTGGTKTGGGTKYVADNSATNKSPSQSAQATSTGAAHSIGVADSLMAVIIGWIAGLAVVL